MKITKRMLKQIIRQELNYVLNEQVTDVPGPEPTEREQTQRADQSEHAVRRGHNKDIPCV